MCHAITCTSKHGYTGAEGSRGRRRPWWPASSTQAIAAFAGPDPDRAVFYPDDDRFLVERGERVDHFDVVFASGDEVTRTVDEWGTGIGRE